jgi:hypothetical protein
MDTRGISPTQALVQEMAELLLAERVQVASAVRPKIGQHWVYRFLKRHSELKSRYNRKYDYQRAKCEDPAVIRAWFLLVRNTIAKYGIAEAVMVTLVLTIAGSCIFVCYSCRLTKTAVPLLNRLLMSLATLQPDIGCCMSFVSRSCAYPTLSVGALLAGLLMRTV